MENQRDFAKEYGPEFTNFEHDGLSCIISGDATVVGYNVKVDDVRIFILGGIGVTPKIVKDAFIKAYDSGQVLQSLKEKAEYYEKELTPVKAVIEKLSAKQTSH